MTTNSGGQHIVHSITLGVTTTGNTAGLSLMMLAVLLGHVLPGQITIRSEGADKAALDNFYFNQLLDLARIKGVEVTVTYANSQGIRAARQWLLEQRRSQWLLMLDDDVVVEPDLVANLHFAADQLSEQDKPWGFICAAKPDVNNSRGYGDFSNSPQPVEKFKTTGAANMVFDRRGHSPETLPLLWLDTGCCLLNVHAIHDQLTEVAFDMHTTNFNAGGEDTVFGLLCAKAGLPGYFVTCSTAWHLEKPKVNFSEMPARAQAILRTIEQHGMSAKDLEKFCTYLPRHTSPDPTQGV